MCGIAGWIDRQNPSSSPEILRAMTDALIHRGPDGDGFYEDRMAHLGHRRLRIIDLQTGDQPIKNEDGTVVVIFNGEIFNYRELRAALQSSGHRFSTNSDTECLVHLYEEYGVELVDHLRGQFAIALWDSKKELCMLARDRMGQKPVYYCHDGHHLVFASELNGMLAHPSVRTEIDNESLAAYFTFKYIPDPRTIFRSIKKLPAAHRLTFTRNGVEITQYWEPSFEQKLDASESELLTELDQVVSEAVRLRLVSDVPLGAFLSGGIDSSLIVAMMARHSTSPVKTFTIGFEHAEHDERAHAREVAERFNTDHHELIVSPDAAEVLPSMVRHFGEPFADSSALPTYYVAKMAREHVTVSLNGDGGDESFAGYRRYADLMRVARFKRLPKPVQRMLASLAAVSPNQFGPAARRIKRWSSELTKPLGAIYQRSVSMSPIHRDRLLDCGRDSHGALQSIDWGEEVFAELSNLDPLDQVLRADQRTYLTGDLLVKIDRMTMAHHVEGRSPLLDHHVVEFAASLAPNLKLRGRDGKYLIKKLLTREMGQEFVDRPKQGFSIPLAKWLADDLNPLLMDCMHDSRTCENSLIDRPKLEELAHQHTNGTHDHSDLLWTYLNLEIWYREVFEKSTSAPTLTS